MLTKTMTQAPRCAALLALTLSLSGCLEWEEALTIDAAGRVTQRITIEGDEGDLDGGALALPGEGYELQRSLVETRDGKTRHRLVAAASFPSAEALPGGFGDARNLRFTTSVRRIRAGERQLLVFERVYAPRAWADYAEAKARAIPSEVEALLKGFQARPWEEKRRVLEGFVRYEVAKSQLWAMAAWDALERPADRGYASLHIAAALREAARSSLAPEAIASWLELPGPELAARAKAAQEQLRDAARNAAAALAPGLAAAAFDELYEDARVAFEVTEDLGDERFTLRVALPGEVLESNGEASGREVTFRFDGKDLRDREHRLIAVVAVAP